MARGRCGDPLLDYFKRLNKYLSICPGPGASSVLEGQRWFGGEAVNGVEVGWCRGGQVS